MQKSSTNRKELYYSLAPLVLGSLLACWLIHDYCGGQQVNFDDATLAKGTTSVFASVDGTPIHGKDIAQASDCLTGVKRRQAAKRALWLGNSQVHAINQYQPGQQNAPPILFQKLKQQSIDLITFSPPNASLQEHYVMFEYLRSQLPIDYLILPAVFDDTREDGIRADISTAFDNEQAAKLLQQTQLGQGLIKRYHEAVVVTDDMAGLAMTVQEKSERFLNNWLNDNCRLWQLRAQGRGKFFMQLYYLRNHVFGISAQSKRPKIAGRYDANMKALETILTVAGENGISVLVYIVPLRDDVAVPYVPSEYEQFKRQVAQMSHDYGAAFCNLEKLVPANLWGQKGSIVGAKELELDFMHFQAPGHKLLANELARQFNLHFHKSPIQVATK